MFVNEVRVVRYLGVLLILFLSVKSNRRISNCDYITCQDNSASAHTNGMININDRSFLIRSIVTNFCCALVICVSINSMCPNTGRITFRNRVHAFGDLRVFVRRGVNLLMQVLSLYFLFYGAGAIRWSEYDFVHDLSRRTRFTTVR